jgi:protein phosphatase
MMSAFLRLNVASGTHPGQIRQINQDFVLADVRPSNMGTALGLLIVADGMGGHKAGEIASKLAAETIRDNLSWMIEQDDINVTIVNPTANNPNSNPLATKQLERRLQLAVKEANKAIYDYARENPTEAGNLGCTATCAIVYGDTVVIANVGDSRTYIFSNGELTQLTDDHSYVWQLIRQGHLDADEIYDHPQRNVITRALGSQSDVLVDLLSHRLNTGDRLLLCSDGVWEMIRDPAELATMIQAENLEMAVDQIISAANEYGGHDNIGVVVAELIAEGV